MMTAGGTFEQRNDSLIVINVLPVRTPEGMAGLGTLFAFHLSGSEVPAAADMATYRFLLVRGFAYCTLDTSPFLGADSQPNQQFC